MNNKVGDLCSCYHSESFHQALSLGIATPNSGHSLPPIPHGTISPTLPRPDHPFRPLAMPTPPTIFNQRTTLPLGVPLNHGTPVLRMFRPHQGLPSSTSEDNRKTSMARSSKSRKRTQVARPCEELLLPDAVDKNVSIMLVPHNVRDALLTVILCS